MSKTLMCLTEPLSFCAQYKTNPEISYSANGILKPKVTEKTHANCSLEDIRRQEKLKGTMPKSVVSRKREATNCLLECVKRRDNLQTYDNDNVRLNVPLYQLNEQSPLRTPSDANISLLKENMENENSIVDFSNLDSSDSASVTDSGIDVLSKNSSPCNSMDALSFSGQDEAEEECSTVNMDIDDFNSSPSPRQKISNFSACQNSGESPAAIYEDLNCLHLTDEAVLSQNNSFVKSPISHSLFNHVASTIYFSLKNEKVASMPDNILPLMKWKLSAITPVLIKELVQQSGFSIVDMNTNEEWLGTWGKHLKCASFKKIKHYQKVNHYPGSFHLGRKDKLWDNYKRMQARFGIGAYNFLPETFYLPNDLNLLKSVWGADDENCWIIKPPASARGTGIKVIHKWSQVPKTHPIIVQRYLSDPYLINGTKFDLRIYVLVTSIEPLRVYVFEDGLVRFASEKYSLSNKSFSNRYVHLTNYSINRKSSSYTSNEDENSCQGHKWTLKTFWTYMSNSGIDIQRIQNKITDMLIKTIICAEGPICRLMKTYAKSTYNCFELFGFDIMLDKNLQPWLLEVNISPSLHTRSLLDSNVKGQMVKDMLNMIGFQVPERKSVCSTANPPHYGVLSVAATKHRALRNRCLSEVEKEKHAVYTFQYEKFDILKELTPDDVRCLIESEDEYHRKGAFRRIFPTETSSKYFIYFEHIRYYNLLLDAWEKIYHTKREEGVRHLQELCDKKVHLQTRIKEPSLLVKPDLEITVH